MFPTFEKIKELADRQGISINKLEENLGYSRNTIYNLKTKKPNAERIAEIADYFNVSTDYLLGRTDNPKIANSTISKEKIDFKKIAAESMSYDGKSLTDDDIDLIAAVLEQRFKNRD
ncbi:TPA: helix-turn-helix transcriptional regulator [Streptococcus pyogenes]|uniref:XRE family transcriptional regulator n=4 Tax=Streptococcus TaxID=1301 RepID=A0A5S4TME6_STRPY|nr:MULTISPECIES: helix-turn-helix transcriptional regulator [Streptococcus]ESU90578.1 Cro/C1-type HTH DNA-binding domain protein [Streptococcus pyogenes GA03747]QBX19230.1 Cro/CI family transcriptional regulator [Streptococcus phage Javan477]QBX20035.1 Cro/CI family transcriptional regulator [Streptococcus phage Javan507]QBX20416.1 Cro/CI family transcriptional regulator [Streptococcus phage Javan521]QBX30388.1 Cro/CI family transcriptional regulator [Streptococcus phage Javan532]HEP6173198.1